MCIALIAGYIIAREEKDDTLKSIMTVPISYCSLLWGKLFVCALLSLFLGMVSAVFTIIANLLMGFPGLSITSVLQTFMQIILNCLFLYIAVMPVRGVLEWSEVQYDELPTAVQNNYAALVSE